MPSGSTNKPNYSISFTKFFFTNINNQTISFKPMLTGLIEKQKRNCIPISYEK
jgi:hypothetical protein